MRNGVHDDVNTHLDGLLVVRPAPLDAYAVTPPAMNIGRTEEHGQPVSYEYASGAVILSVHIRQAAPPTSLLNILHRRQSSLAKVVHIVEDFMLSGKSAYRAPAECFFERFVGGLIEKIAAGANNTIIHQKEAASHDVLFEIVFLVWRELEVVLTSHKQKGIFLDGIESVKSHNGIKLAVSRPLGLPVICALDRLGLASNHGAEPPKQIGIPAGPDVPHIRTLTLSLSPQRLELDSRHHEIIEIQIVDPIAVVGSILLCERAGRGKAQCGAGCGCYELPSI